MDEVVERDAKLFEAGVYEDKGVEVTEEDLDRIVEGHQPVPIKVEHTDSPLLLGTLVKVWRVGKELFGRLAFTKPAWELVKSSKARKLSVGLKKDKSALVEVSLVRNPRVADAAVFAGEKVVCFETENEHLCDNLETGNDAVNVIEEADAAETASADEVNEERKGDGSMEFDETLAEKDRRIEELEEQLRAKDVEVKVDELKRAGKLVPPAEKFAKAILMAPGSHIVKFDDTKKPVADLFLEFLEVQPKMIEFSELAKASGEETVDLEPEARALYEKLGLTPEAVVKYKDR